VVESGRSAALPLAASGRLVIGRAEDADLPLQHPMISRRHVVLHLGDRIEIEDLGSANGTVVAGERMKPHTRRELRPGEAVFVGAAVLVLENRATALGSAVQVEPDALLEDMPALAGEREGVAIIRLDLETEVDIGWLSAALSGLEIRSARLACVGRGSWRLVFVCADPAIPARTLTEMANRLSRWAVRASGDSAFLPSPVRETSLRDHPLLGRTLATSSGQGEALFRNARMCELFKLV
jgi:hypothetical protein